MRFKDWIELDEARYKGFQRQFLQSHPNIPKYVADQLYSNRFSAQLDRNVKQHAAYTSPTIGHEPIPSDPSRTVTIPQSVKVPSPRPSSPSEILNNSEGYLNSINWMPKPVVIQVSPLDFDDQTLNLFMSWKFGYDPKDHAVKNDTQRFDIQRNILAAKKEGDNEPIIVVRYGNKYKLLEGFHRTMLHLLSPHDENKGSPPDQIESLKAGGGAGNLDLTRWRRVPILAYVGTIQQQAAARAAMSEI